MQPPHPPKDSSSNGCIYLYDGSLEGLINAVATAIKTRAQILSIVDRLHHRPHLFCETVKLATSREQAKKLMGYLHSLDPEIAQVVVSAYLSGQPDIGLHLYHFVQRCLQIGKKVTGDYSDSSTRSLLTLHQKIHTEVHRYKGLLRFYRMDNQLLYAPFAPEYNILSLCVPHFRRRLANERWILHDLRRDLALLSDKEELKEIEIDPDFCQHVKHYGKPPKRNLAAGEKEYQQLWKTFHQSIGNTQRLNRKLQKKHIPQRYWQYLVEQQ
ncbi:MAG: hypothetical protein CSB23_00910 [Deltaproteobacteria bacterium]|nr:MAG: hypothetical protein CSB23_00910 [Deltaproteobacteria bacterium]